MPQILYTWFVQCTHPTSYPLSQDSDVLEISKFMVNWIKVSIILYLCSLKNGLLKSEEQSNWFHSFTYLQGLFI